MDMLTFAEIAARTNTTENAVKGVYLRAMRKLRRSHPELPHMLASFASRGEVSYSAPYIETASDF